MPSRRQQYLDTYARAAASIERQKQIRADIADEQQQVRYLDSLLGQERATLAAIEANFKTAPPQSLDQAVSLLKEQYASEDARRRRAAGEGAALERATSLTAEDRALLTVTQRTGKDAVASAAEALIANPKTTPEKAQAAFDYALGQLGKDSPAVARLQSALSGKGSPTTRKAAPSVRALTPEEAARQEATDEAFRAAFFAGPSGIVGGYEGKAIADARKGTVAPENTSFNTAEDAFNAAIAAMGDGALTADEFGSVEDFNYAKSIYAEAQAKKAYRNDERIHFEPSVIEARLRLRDLQQRRESAAGSAYKDPAREAARRELVARGIKLYDEDSEDAWRNQYAQYQGTPYYDVYIQAHEAVDRWMDEGGSKALSPSTKAQQAAVQYASMLDAAKKPYSPATIMDQLEKAGFSDTEAAEATSFLMAYREIGGPKQGKSTYDALKDAEAKAKAQIKRAGDLAAEIEADFEDAVRTIQIEEAKVLNPAADMDYYKRLVEAGTPPEKARELARAKAQAEQAAAVAPPAPEPAKSVAPAPAPSPAPAPAPKGFLDPTDPNSPTYYRTDFGFKYTNPAGKEVEVPMNTRAGIALAMAEKGDVEAIKSLQQKPRGGGGGKGGGNKGGGGGNGGDGTPPPETAPTDPFQRRPGESDADYAKRLREMP